MVTPCDSILGPYVQFTDGSGKRIQDPADLPDGLPTDPSWPVAKIWDIGELLVPVGEFLENNHTLAPSPYVREWHEQVVQKNSIPYPESLIEALEQAKEHGNPLAPEYVALYNEVSAEDMELLKRDTKIDSQTQAIMVAPTSHQTVYRLGIDIDAEGNLYGDRAVLWAWVVSNGRKVWRLVRASHYGLEQEWGNRKAQNHEK